MFEKIEGKSVDKFDLREELVRVPNGCNGLNGHHGSNGHNGLNGHIGLNGHNGLNGSAVAKHVEPREQSLDEAMNDVFDSFVTSFRRQSALDPNDLLFGDRVDVFSGKDFVVRGTIVDQDDDGNVKVMGFDDGREVTLWVATADCRYADGQETPATKREWYESRGV